MNFFLLNLLYKFGFWIGNFQLGFSEIPYYLGMIYWHKMKNILESKSHMVSTACSNPTCPTREIIRVNVLSVVITIDDDMDKVSWRWYISKLIWYYMGICDIRLGGGQVAFEVEEAKWSTFKRDEMRMTRWINEVTMCSSNPHKKLSWHFEIQLQHLNRYLTASIPITLGGKNALRTSTDIYKLPSQC